ncbi:LysM peptidoglycan-binding domain-containing protein [Emticicia sp. CRIBPO]|uniref:LysM peptidoglycan-binding domain-containing protein n=1 Tax=Emticicia sp. CRIBPO TaxID=2683258 RepID=UPI001413652C|nr:LysM peptidoglycan-binding domain-containing protein [Emticicia sp. CRIBPO]NBA87635.1 LysM peptidoglycan-binding domain-containing protein [Emticicia sp. CRIBPO]
MEFEERNPKPQETSKNLPVVVLGALIGIICLLLYVGWHFMSDDASNASEITDEPVKAVGEFDSEGKEDTEASSSTDVATAAPAEEEPVIDLPKKTEKVTETKKEETKPVEKSSSKGEFTSHLVESGETFNGIANRYNVSVNTLKSNNSGVEPSGIKVGVTKLRVPVQTIHTVGPGDVLRVVAKKYDISLDLLMKANGKTKNFAQRGEKLVIPKKNKE